jgi:hypothetical protein
LAAGQRGAAAGVTTLARIVARVRDEATDELHAKLAGLPDAHQAARLEILVVVLEGRGTRTWSCGARGRRIPAAGTWSGR